MAKEQSLSLNPVKISGTCGRLMCCLKYEQEAYEHLRKTTPRVGAVVTTPKGEGVVTGVDLLPGRVTVRFDKGQDTSVEVFSREEVHAVRQDRPERAEKPDRSGRQRPSEETDRA